jgi:hypothetical protein
MATTTVETATYGAESVSETRIWIEQLIDLQTTLRRYFGVPILDKSSMFGDNESVVNSAMNPHSKLHKRHTALSYHRVHEIKAFGAYIFYHLDGENNPADILSKHWCYSQVWHMLRSLFFAAGETEDSLGRTERDTTMTNATVGEY